MKSNILKYHISIENGLHKSLKHFSLIIEGVLNDKRTWKKYNFVRTFDKNEAKVKIILTKPSTIFSICKLKGLSCTDMIKKEIYINSNRWLRGSKKSKMNIKNYRKYLINHEMFHALGGGHNECKSNQICGVTHQQTLGIPHKSKPNPWPKDWEQKQLYGISFLYMS